MAVLLIGRWPDEERERWLQCLRAAMPAEQWLSERPADDDAAALAAIEVAVVANPAPGVLQGLPGLRLVQSLWAGVEKLLADSTLPPDLPLCRMVDPAMSAAMLQTGVWAVLGQHRGFFQLQQQQQAALWRQPEQRRADEWQVLVLGMGELGAGLARALRQLGYAVAGYSRRPHGLADVAEVQGEAALAQALSRADSVVNLLPLTTATQDFFNATRFAQMKPGAGLINLARGAHVVEADLLAALDAGQIGHALLDVFRSEPLVPDHRFWRHPRVTVLPHTAAQTDPRTAALVVARNLQALRSGAPLLYSVERSQGY